MWGMAHNYPIFVQIGPKKQFLKRFFQLFSRNAGLQHKLLILININESINIIESPNIFHWKSAEKSKLGLIFGAKFGTN